MILFFHLFFLADLVHNYNLFYNLCKGFDILSRLRLSLRSNIAVSYARYRIYPRHTRTKWLVKDSRRYNRQNIEYHDEKGNAMVN